MSLPTVSSRGPGRWGWGGYALALLLAPWAVDSSAGLTLLTQMGCMIVVCLSFNLLLGQGGLLSFGHALYAGLGGFAVVHALRAAGEGQLLWPVSAMPLLGGLAGALAATLVGGFTTYRGGTPFAMITLALGELVVAAALMLPAVFGGEGGLSANRVVGPPVLGITFGPDLQLYYLVATYCGLATVGLHAFTRTPLGMLLNAVRDNPDRVAVLGFSPHGIRYRAFVLAGFVAGVGGGLSALQFENVTTESLGTLRSGAIVLFTVLGGSALVSGSVLAGVLMVLALMALSDLTRAWQVYVGLAFVLVVMAAPGGLAGAATGAWTAWRAGRFRGRGPAAALLVTGAVPALAGTVALLEMAYHRQLDAALDPRVRIGHLLLDTTSPATWAVAMAGAVTGFLLVAWGWRTWRSSGAGDGEAGA